MPAGEVGDYSVMATDPPRRLWERVEELALLFEISRILEQSMDLNRIIHPVLQTIADHLGIVRGTITLLDRRAGEMFIEAAFGLSSSQRERGRYRLGEGITGAVVESGKLRIIPRVADDPQFLNRTGARRGQKQKEISFICVPIKLGNETIGALGVDSPQRSQHQLEDDARLLTVISSLIAQAVKIRRDIMEENRQLHEENSRLYRELRARFRPSNIIGNSAAMQTVFDMVAHVSHSDATVLIRGESGTGKELVAQALHYSSPRADRPLIRVNCAALPESVIESELFGHEKGAFTGAVSTRKGRFELADNGSIFLDEIGDLSPILQVKLLRILQEREFERVGGNRTLRVNVRIITATNRDLEQLMEGGKFREDLYYRLNVFPIHIPPLRDRKSDLLLLVDHFIEKYANRNRTTIRRLSTPAIDLLMNYHWPGNVRELENCIERAVLLSVDGVIHSHHLPPSLQSAESSDTGVSVSLQDALDNLEREMIIEALKSTTGNVSRAAELLRISERIIGLRVRKHGILARSFRKR